MLGRLPYNDAPNLGDKIVSSWGHALLLPPSSGRLGGERREHDRPLWTQKERALLCWAACSAFTCHLQRLRERRRAWLFQVFLPRHKDTFSPTPLSQPPFWSHCSDHMAPKAATSKWSGIADWLDHSGSTLEWGKVGSITAVFHPTQSSHRTVI